MAEKIVVDIEFKTNVSKISKDLESVKDSLSETNESLEDIKKTGKGTEGALKKIGKGFKGVGLAMKAMGIGLVIEAFNFLKEIMMQNQTVIDGVAIATETLGVLFNQVTSVVTDVFDAVSKSSEGFEGLQKVMSGLLTIAVTPLKLSFYGITLAIQEGQLAWEKSFFGDGDPETIAQLNEKISETKQNLTEVVEDVVDAGTQIATNFAEAVTEVGSIVTIATETATEGIEKISVESALTTGKALADAKKNEELLEVLRAKQQLQSQLDAEIQRQIRDDVSRSIQDRIEANEELGRILEDQTAKEKAIADEKVRIAKLELDTNQNSVELQTAYQQALLEQIDIEERIAGQKSEQLTNEQGLIQEQKDAIMELATIGKTERELELTELDQWYKQKIDLATKSGQDTTAIQEEFAKQQVEIEKKYKMQQLDILQNSINMAGNLFAEGSAMAKVTGVASATIDTYKAVNMALASSPPPFSFVTAGLTLATGIKNVKEILSVKTEKPANVQAPSGGSIPSGGGQGGQSTDMDSLVDLSGLPSITEQFNTAFTQDAPIQAYVVEQQVTDSQQINTMIQQKSTL